MVQKVNPTTKRPKKIIGLTGGFGTGKSTVAHLFEELGAYVIDADQLAHEALLKGSDVFLQVVKLFGPSILSASGEIDRQKLAETIFKDPKQRKKLEALIHPYVFRRMEEQISQAEEHVVILEVPLLFETGLDQRCDQVIVVDASDAAASERLKERGFSDQQRQARQAVQMLMDKKKKQAHFLINNNGSLKATKQQVAEVWRQIITE